MTGDSEMMSRLGAYDRDGRLIGWTPENVSWRLVEAAVVFSRTPALVGPSRLKSCWPAIVVTAQDLVDEETQQRLMRFPHLVGNWERHIDDKTHRHMSAKKQAEWESQPAHPSPDQYSRAEEALSWPMRYLHNRPLLADALTLWALCEATGASIRATIRSRVEAADAARYPARRHTRHMARLANARESRDPTPTMTRQEAMPGKNLVHQNIAGYRRTGAAIISAELTASGVVVRADDPELTRRKTE